MSDSSSFTLYGSNGNIIADKKTGYIKYSGGAEAFSGKDRVDVDAWKNYWHEEIKDSHDALEFGFFCADGSYIPPQRVKYER